MPAMATMYHDTTPPFVRFSAGGSGFVPGAGVRHRRRGRLRMFRDSRLDRRDFSSVQYDGSVSL